jgi:hypothetical protein
MAQARGGARSPPRGRRAAVVRPREWFGDASGGGGWQWGGEERRGGSGRNGEAHHPPFRNSNVTVRNVGFRRSGTVGSGHGRPGLAGGAFSTRRKILPCWGIPVLLLWEGRHTCQAAPAVVQVRCAHVAVATPISGINRNLDADRARKAALVITKFFCFD